MEQVFFFAARLWAAPMQMGASAELIVGILSICLSVQALYQSWWLLNNVLCFL